MLIQQKPMAVANKMDNLRAAVIGIGNMGSAHASCIARGEVGGLELVAVCDINADKINFFTSLYPDVKKYFDYKELIKSDIIDCVIIATPHPSHAEIAICALENGINVMLEKPADISISKVSKLGEIAEKSGKVFGIMFNQRTNPLYRKAKEIVHSGDLGEIIRSVWIITNWFRTQSYYDSGNWRATWSGEGGGVLLNQAPHNLDLWQWICGMPESITAFCEVGKYHNIEVEDDVTIFAKYKNGATGTFITSTGEFPGTNRLEITGDKGKLVIENQTLKWWKLKNSISETREKDSRTFASIDYDYEEIIISGEGGHKEMLENFANAVLNGEELIADGYCGINELAISNAAYLSSWNNNIEIKLPFDYNEFDEKLSELQSVSKKSDINEDYDISSHYNDRWKVKW